MEDFLMAVIGQISMMGMAVIKGNMLIDMEIILSNHMTVMVL